MNDQEKEIYDIEKDELDEIFVDKHIKCATCNSFVGYIKNGKEYINNGVYQIGQGKNQPLLNFCNKKHKEIYERIAIKNFQEGITQYKEEVKEKIGKWFDNLRQPNHEFLKKELISKLEDDGGKGK